MPTSENAEAPGHDSQGHPENSTREDGAPEAAPCQVAHNVETIHFGTNELEVENWNLRNRLDTLTTLYNRLVREKPQPEPTAEEKAYWRAFIDREEAYNKAHHESSNRGIWDRLSECRFRVETPPPIPVPRYFMAGKPVCTPGNLTAIIAQAKAGKSALVGGFLAAAICAENGHTGDCLGVTANPEVKGIVLHIDTEQAPAKHHSMILQSLLRANVAEAPKWLHSYALTGWNVKSLLDGLRDLTKVLRRPFHSIIIDGLADFVSDVNDAEECNAFVTELQALAIKLDCPIICILHENPRQNTGKMRGHLGSQLERKAESNLRMTKVDGVTSVFSDLQRGAPILEGEGPRFAWSDEHHMHVSVTTAPKDSAKVQEVKTLAKECFVEVKCMSYTDLRDKIVTLRGWVRSTAEGRIALMERAGVIVTNAIGLKEYKL